VDGQRQFPGDPDRWYGEDDDHGRVPGQRGAERFAESPEAGRVYGEAYPDPAYGGHEAPDYLGEPEPPAYPAADRPARRRSNRPVRVGRRSGLELPDAEPGADYPAADYPAAGEYESPADYESAEEPPRYRAERLDRQALRREGQTYQSQGSGFDPLAADQPTTDRTPDRGLTERPEAYPTVPPAYVPPAAPTQMTPAVPVTPTAVYLAKRPGIGALIATVAVVIELLVVRVLVVGEFGHTVNAGGVIGGVFAMAGVPLVGLGLYGLARGAATAGGNDVVRTWLRPPLAYLPIGLLLLIVAGLAT
jgi:hypothetical protein